MVKKNEGEEPSDSLETMWMLLSLLRLPIDKQVEVIGGIPRSGDPLVDDYNRNNASLLLRTISHYFDAWWDEFEPNCKAANALISLVNNEMDLNQTYDDFIGGADWTHLRLLACEALEEAGLEPWSVPGKIKFDDYIEIVFPEDLP